MKSIIKGQIIKETYSVVDKMTTVTVDGKERRIFTGKPYIYKKSNIVDWKDILTVDGEVYYNANNAQVNCNVIWFNEFNISASEPVRELEKVFRADLNEMHHFTSKIVEKQTVNKEESEKQLAVLLADFNEQMIESNERMLVYCKLHKLNPRETDCEELFKIVYPNKEYIIVGGKMRARQDTITSNDGIYSKGYNISYPTYNEAVIATKEFLNKEVN